MRFRRHIALMFICLQMIGLGRAQTPCHDTLIRVLDTICEGDTYHFNGRELSYAGAYFDTIQRANSDCDSIIYLTLTVLFHIEPHPVAKAQCRGKLCYHIYGYEGIPFHQWSAIPEDTTLFGQENNIDILVNPSKPTTYTLYIDYRATPQCPASGSVSINPIEPVVASMHVWPEVLTLDQMDLKVEDFSLGTREATWGGWAGRHWYINGIRQADNHEQATFHADNSWGDTVEVMMEAYSPTCLDTSYRKVPFRRIAISFPNVFIPNGSIRLKPWTLGIMEWEAWIYDRQGILVSHINSKQDGWDGTSHGNPCRQGTYVYKCRYREVSNPNSTQTTAGTITLIR